MATDLIIDPAGVDITKAAFGKEAVLAANKQRFEFEQLDGVVSCDTGSGIAVGFKVQTQGEFWVKGHIPGRPIMPGVLQIEMAAQMCSFFYHVKFGSAQGDKFFGFGGVDKVKFRGAVLPGETLIMAVRATNLRSRIAVFDTQGYVHDKLVFEGIITGVIF